jgi:PEP-CTERM motif
LLTLHTLRRTLATGLFWAATLLSAPASASLLWHWQYTGVDIEARGQFTTTDSADSNGYYEIIGITGTRNGAAITSLTPTGEGIPGNEPYVSDNLLRPGLNSQITKYGFGFSTADGRYANPYWADWLDPKRTMEVLTTDPDTFIDEVAVSFSAELIPEPSTIGLLLGGLAMLGLSVRQRLRP